MQTKTNKQQALKQEIDYMVNSKWKFFNKDWPLIRQSKYHRTELKEVHFIEDVKKDIFDKLGYTGPFAFLVDYYCRKDRPGPYRNIEKALLLIYQLLVGNSIREMAPYLPYSSYYEIYKNLWIKEYDELNKWVDNCLQNYFSNDIIRALSASLYNPQNFRSITLYMDGHDNRIVYENVETDKKKLYSYKLKKPAIRTQMCSDVNEMFIYISQSMPCKDNPDGKMFLSTRIDRIMAITDCLLLDGAYTFFVDKIIEKNNAEGHMLTSDNFIFPIRKINNEQLNEDEINYNQQHAAKRSCIETQFANLSNTFKRFQPTKRIKVTNLKTFNIQLKFACLMLNFRNFSVKFGINPPYTHKMWLLTEFDFPLDKERNTISQRVDNQIEKLARMKLLQDNFINQSMNHIINSNESDEIMDDQNTSKEIDSIVVEIPTTKKRKAEITK